MQTVSLGDSLHEMSSLFSEKINNKYFKMSSAKIFTQHAKLWMIFKHKSTYWSWIKELPYLSTLHLRKQLEAKGNDKNKKDVQLFLFLHNTIFTLNIQTP